MIFDFAHLTEEQALFVDQLDAMGEVAVSGTVVADTFGAMRPLAIAWLEAKRKQRELQSAQEAAETRALARMAAGAARATAQYTLWIAVATFLAALVAAVTAVISLLHK